ncbi:MAG: MgtC/SapB family protein [bacterium]
MPDLNLFGPIDIISCLVAILCGFIIGFERQWNGKTAGIRTSIMICLGACIFVSTGSYYWPEEGAVRILGQIITGVGFLGAGVIIAREGLVHGVTSAAVIWMLAAIGSLTGLKNHVPALLLTLVTVFILVSITYLERSMSKLKRGVHRDSDLVDIEKDKSD